MFNKLFKNRMQGKNKHKAEHDSNEVQDIKDFANEELKTENLDTNESVNEENTTASESDKLKSENEELKDKYLRLYSDFENYKRRTTKERIDLFKMAGQDVLKSLIPVIDDFERAEKAFETSTDAASLAEGVKLVSAKLKNTLEHQGLIAYISIGENFDADLHEAITKIPAPSKDLKGKIVDEVEKGYKLHDKVIRFAKVIVGE